MNSHLPPKTPKHIGMEKKSSAPLPTSYHGRMSISTTFEDFLDSLELPTSSLQLKPCQKTYAADYLFKTKKQIIKEWESDRRTSQCATSSNGMTDRLSLLSKHSSSNVGNRSMLSPPQINCQASSKGKQKQNSQKISSSGLSKSKFFDKRNNRQPSIDCSEFTKASDCSSSKNRDSVVSPQTKQSRALSKFKPEQLLSHSETPKTLGDSVVYNNAKAFLNEKERAQTSYLLPSLTSPNKGQIRSPSSVYKQKQQILNNGKGLIKLAKGVHAESLQKVKMYNVSQTPKMRSSSKAPVSSTGNSISIFN